MKNIQYPAPKQEYKVLVRCFTYNHSKYIEDALNGFAMQQTNFPFVCIVMDDASTDGEQEVIKVWMERECDMSRAETIDIPTSVVIIVPHKTNLSCTFAFYLLKQNLYGTGKKIYYLNPWREKCIYEAICEGDDYWIYPLKLQKQVDFLEENPEYGMVRTEIHRYYQEKKEFEYNFFSTIRKDIHEDSLREYLLKGWFAAPCTWLLRRELYSTVPVLPKDCFSGDINVILCIASSSKIGFIKDATAVYRILPISASHFSKMKDYLKFALKVKNTRKFYARKQSSLKFRLMFWWRVCVKSMRPSLRNCKLLYPSWFTGIVVDFFDCLIFDKN